MPIDQTLPVGALTLESPARKAFSITPNDTQDLAVWARALWIGGAGTVSAILWGDDIAVSFQGIPAGTLLPIMVRRVRATGTTATAIVGLT